MNTKPDAALGRFFLFGLCIIAAIIVSDQYTKWLVMETMLRTTGETPGFFDWFLSSRPLAYFYDERESYNSVELAPFLNFVMVWNCGVSFGLLDDCGSDMRRIALIGVSLLVSILMTVALALVRRRSLAWSLALIVGGAVGNIIDRVRFGAVADFVDLHVAGYHWPAFNIADTAIVIGAVVLILDSLLLKDKHFLSA